MPMQHNTGWPHNCCAVLYSLYSTCTPLQLTLADHHVVMCVHNSIPAINLAETLPRRSPWISIEEFVSYR